ncbi:MAG TPA: hypothetical protein VGN63_00620 [Flavisolibacter sp.]|jgi:cbb3-type cytochrome oxidase subunit 3|nr:hypothetical protein [Flavisolibacter sp.]
MNKTVKKIATVILIILAVVFILFVAEVVYMNRNSGKTDAIEVKRIVIEEVQEK